MKMDFKWESVNGLARALGGRVELLEKVFKEKGLTPAMIQKIAVSGFASDFFDIGDEIVIPWTDYSVDPPVTYQVPNIIVHFDDVEDPDGNVHKDAMWLMWKYALPQTMRFDAQEKIEATEATFEQGYYYYKQGSTAYEYIEQNINYGDAIPEGETYYKHILSKAGDRISAGSNNWSQSAVRQWLNSDADKDEWWTPQHASDVAPDKVSTLPGVLSGFSEDWLNIIKPVKVLTVANVVCDNGDVNVTYDRLFIPSLHQIAENSYGVALEGSYWDYFKEENKKNPNAYWFVASISNITKNVSWFFRSSTRSSIDAVVGIHPTYGLMNVAARSTLCVRPACVIY